MKQEIRCPECWHKEICHVEELGACVAWIRDDGLMCGCQYRFSLAGQLKIDYSGIIKDLDEMQRRANIYIYQHDIHPNRNALVVFRDHCIALQNEICRGLLTG